MSNVLAPYLRKCKDTQGGFIRMWIYPYLEYDPSEIQFDGVDLIKFPDTCVNPFEVEGSYTQSTALEQGNFLLAHSVTFRLTKVYEYLNPLIFMQNDFRIIVETRNGQLLMLGTRNGLEGSVTNASGQTKAEFNGFDITFTGKEENYAGFITDFASLGITICDVESLAYFNYTLNFDV